MELNNLKELAVKTVKKAGKFLNSEKNLEKEILSEIGRDIKLKIDQHTESLIRDELEVSGIMILGEEFGGDNIDGLMWIVDPIDGTANYFRGLDQCCISIALMDGRDALIGVIYNFNNDELYVAVKNHGAFLNDKKILVSTISEKIKHP